MPDRPLPGDFNNLWVMPDRATPEGMTATLFVGAVPREMPFFLALKHTISFLVPSYSPGTFAAGLTKPGGKERSPPPADPARSPLREDLLLFPAAPYDGSPTMPTAFLASAESFSTSFAEALILAFISILRFAPKNSSPAKFYATAALYLCIT